MVWGFDSLQGMLSERKIYSQTYGWLICITIQKQYDMNICLLMHDFWTVASWKCPPWMSMQELQETDFCESTCFHHVWPGLFTTISYETSFHSCWKKWICRLGFIYGSCMMVLHHACFLRFGNYHQLVSGTVDRTARTNSMACSFPQLKSHRRLSGASEIYRLC